MKSEFIRVPCFLLVQLILVFGMHLLLNNFAFAITFTPYITEAYIANYLLAVGEFLIIYFLGKKVTDHLGYIFMGSSALKFMIAFAIFHPLYKVDGEISKMEFATIFIPYASALILITLQLMKVLKKSDKSRN